MKFLDRWNLKEKNFQSSWIFPATRFDSFFFLFSFWISSYILTLQSQVLIYISTSWFSVTFPFFNLELSSSDVSVLILNCLAIRFSLIRCFWLFHAWNIQRSFYIKLRSPAILFIYHFPSAFSDSFRRASIVRSNRRHSETSLKSSTCDSHSASRNLSPDLFENGREEARAAAHDPPSSSSRFGNLPRTVGQ